MSDIAVWMLFLLVFPGMLFSVGLGLCLCWVDRKVTALVQWRQGPPVTQPFWDVVKLLGKEVIVPAQAWGGFLLLPFVAFAGAALGATLVWLAVLGLGPQPAGDLIVVLYLLALPGIAVVLGGTASGNPLAAVGASREIKLMLAYELPLVIALLVAVFQVRALPGGDTTRSATLSLQGIAALQADTGSVLWRPSGILAFLVALLCAHAKLGFVPFDLAEAETELGEGAMLEYSGAALAFFKLTNAVMLATLPVLLVLVFWGGLLPSTLGVLAFAGKVLLIVVVFVLVKNTNPRIRIDQALRLFWGPATAVALVALFLAQLGW